MTIPAIDIPMKNVIIPKFKDVFMDIMNHRHSVYIFPGGRGSTKSSFVSICIILLIIANPNCHAVCFRKVGNTIQKSIYSQITWAIYTLGLESLFHIPKTYASPIVYKPTGQQIIFMGLDDADKVKSIKLPFGYIGINWFEELDQYNGKEQLRKVTQSTKRGGQLFWDFRTFNPPISKNNWANEYADEEEHDKNGRSQVIRSTYLDVPEEWLGQEFLDEAEDLKRKNSRAYEHEYMGVATGTGGDVFPNACEFDCNELIPRYDAVGNVVAQVPIYTSFDRIYNGLDWGFAIDPARYVKLHFDKRKHDVYIYREYNAIQMTNKPLFKELYEEQKLITKEELLTADSAEQKSIMDFKNWGAYIRGADKGPDSVRYGIKWLQGLNHIYIDRNYCPETWKEFSQYEYEQDKDGNFISAYPDENNHSIDATRYALEKYYNRKGN